MPTALAIKEGTILIKGPNREKIFDARRLFEESRCVDFTIDGVELRARVFGDLAEDGSGRSWMLLLEFSTRQDGFTLDKPIRVTVYYSEATRNGRVARMGFPDFV